VIAEARGAGASPGAKVGEAIMLTSLMGVIGLAGFLGVAGSSAIVSAWIPNGLCASWLSLVMGRSQALAPGARFMVGLVTIAMFC
jgi:hypothetical protein